MRQFFCELLFICSAATPGAQSIDDLAYGTMLYEYYQEDYQAALLNVMIAESRGQLGEDVVRFELAKGSFAFAHGMYDYANEIYTAVAEGELTDLDQMRLAFHLSGEYYRRQDWTALGQELAKIELGESWLGKERVHPDVEFMKAEHAVQKKDFALAEAAFARMDAENPLRAYGIYNLGVAYRAAGDLARAMRTFRTLSKMPTFTEEAFDLAQRARLALALIAREQKNHTRAESVLAELPAEGRYQDIAMAAYGGLAMDTENYDLAARIWMTLQEAPYWRPSTAAARLGFPMSLENLALTDKQASAASALLQYREAEKSFTERLASLTALTQAAQDPEWLSALLAVFARALQLDQTERATEAQQPEMQALMKHWQEQLGHTGWLQWLAMDEVHQALVQWRDLGAMQLWLRDLSERMDALREVAAEQQYRSRKARGMLVDNGLLAARTELEESVSSLKAMLDGLAHAQPEPSTDWMLPIATDDERARLGDLDRMKALLVHMAPSDQAKWAGRIDRLVGVLFYQIAAEQDKRTQSLNKSLRSLEISITAIDAKVERVITAEKHFIAGFATEFSHFNERAEDLLAQVDRARVAREALLADEIRGRMQKEMAGIEKYLLVTRIAIARATDRLALRSDELRSSETPLREKQR